MTHHIPSALDDLDAVLAGCERDLERRLRLHIEDTKGLCNCQDCDLFDAIVEARHQRRLRLAPDACQCAVCTASVSRNDAAETTRQFGMALCGFHHAQAVVRSKRREASHAAAPL